MARPDEPQAAKARPATPRLIVYLEAPVWPVKRGLRLVAFYIIMRSILSREASNVGESDAT